MFVKSNITTRGSPIIIRWMMRFPTPQFLVKIVDGIDKIEMKDHDAKGDLYEYLLSKIAIAGTNGQFCTPRHIIQMMVELMKLKNCRDY